ncbi:dihydrofolate reductase [Botrimarina hoheduenensis]|uniref:dihydrofolate reductase n=1 Tax=Botrimarina hoheduenensis TaxID=2528000 RepID=UPI0011B38F4F|nr:dihydrofolate reductase [Botrimarina hoheduenensis]
MEIVVAASVNGVIGREGDLPWRLPADLAQFKRLTMGHALIMGRKTYASIGRPLPGRTSIVLSRSQDYNPGHAGVFVTQELHDAVRIASAIEDVSHERVFVIGGGQIYRLALPLVDRVHLTRVETTVAGDATFPTLDPAAWQLTAAQRHEADEKNECAFTFETWERVAQPDGSAE